MSDTPKDAKGIFLAALDIGDAAERAAFVERSCGGDAALRQRVEDLLRAYGQSGGPLEKLAAALAPTEMAEPIGERVGDVIAGRYKLLEALGQGGMGAVFMAQQTQPVKRVVALKLIKLGMDSKQVLARFEAERQALALMDHPNIAKVLDAGTTDSGRPFFVMELVKGVPITRFCDERQLSPRQRLELFIPVCQAIQHAHQKGIIHRDIKPTNVLVALYDDRPVPKVIDFGVAKAAGLQLTDATLMTGFGAIVGTPEYMSPEQAQLNQLDIDTRSDVYALGVLLYELLTGTTPIDRKRLNQGALFEVLRIIREEEPPRPSTRLSTSDALASIAATRATEPSKLAKLMRGELDWIVMKCLEKDRSRRYETANGLAHDLQHYLADEVVEAQPPTAGYRLRKFARKHRTALATATTIILLLVAGVLVSTWQAVRATRAEAEARQERDAAEAASDEIGKAYMEVAYAQGAAAAAVMVAKQRLAEAQAERKRADTQRDEARLTAYASGMQLAQRAWEENNVVRARELLEEVPKEAAGRKLRGFEWHYLSRLCHSEALTLKGHRFPVSSVAFSPDGQRVASASFDHVIKIWDSATGKELLTLKGHAEPVSSVAFSPDGHRLASGSWDKSVKIWDSATGKEMFAIKGHTGGVWSVAFSPDGQRLATGSQDKSVKIWDSTTGKELFSLMGHADAVSSVAFSPDGQRLASGGWDSTVKIHNSATGKQLLDLKGHALPVISVAFSPDSRRLASGSWDNTVKIWDSTTGDALVALKGHGNWVQSVAFSPDGLRLASGSKDKTVTLWNSATGNELFRLKGHADAANSVAFSPDGQRLASASDDNTVKIWDIATGNELFKLKVHPDAVNSVVFSPDGQRVASGGRDTRVKIWDVTTGEELCFLKGHTGWVRSVAFSPDGKRLASGSDDRTVRIWDIATGTKLLKLKAHASLVMSVAFSPDGHRLASGGFEGTAKIWDSATGKQLLELRDTAGAVEGVAFSPDGRRLASASFNVKIWDSPTGKELFALTGHKREALSVAFSPDGHRLGSANDDHTVKIWDVASGKQLFSLKGHAGVVRSVAFSPDGQRLASGSDDETVRIWDVASGKELFSLKSHAGGVTCLAFSPDGQRLASANGDGSIHFWETTISVETKRRRRTTQMVAEFFGRLRLRVDVLEQLRTLPGLSPSQRQEAITLARSYSEDPSTLNELAWPLVNLPGGEMSGYRRALRYSEEACQLEPNNGLSLNTLGVAYYRVGDYAKALETLLRSDQINKPQFQGSIPSDLAFLTMTQQQLGHAKEAQAELDRLRERIKDPRWAKDDEAQGFLREAEALLATPKTPGGK